MSDSPLLCVVTGMEHSGTTFLSKLITAHSRVNAAFECGVLMAESPAGIPEVQPWADWFTTPVNEGHWGLKRQQLLEVAGQPNWDGAYAKLIEHCPLFREGEDRIVDKSPRYLQSLPEILAKVPSTPCLVLEKDALLMYHSYKRRDFDLKRFADYFNTCQAALREAEAKFSVTRISQERLSAEQADVFVELCKLLGLEFDERFVDRRWCKHNMHGISFIWLFKKPYDYAKAVAKARAEVADDEIAFLKKKLERIGGDTVFTALDAS
ncbi:MAG: hypothetical protein ACI8UO_001853 [Verrucomicrobiales bacterium]